MKRVRVSPGNRQRERERARDTDPIEEGGRAVVLLYCVLCVCAGHSKRQIIAIQRLSVRPHIETRRMEAQWSIDTHRGTDAQRRRWKSNRRYYFYAVAFIGLSTIVRRSVHFPFTTPHFHSRLCRPDCSNYVDDVQNFRVFHCQFPIHSKITHSRVSLVCTGSRPSCALTTAPISFCDCPWASGFVTFAGWPCGVADLR